MFHGHFGKKLVGPSTRLVQIINASICVYFCVILTSTSADTVHIYNLDYICIYYVHLLHMPLLHAFTTFAFTTFTTYAFT